MGACLGGNWERTQAAMGHFYPVCMASRDRAVRRGYLSFMAWRTDGDSIVLRSTGGREGEPPSWAHSHWNRKWFFCDFYQLTKQVTAVAEIQNKCIKILGLHDSVPVQMWMGPFVRCRIECRQRSNGTKGAKRKWRERGGKGASIAFQTTSTLLPLKSTALVIDGWGLLEWIVAILCPLSNNSVKLLLLNFANNKIFLK